MLEVSGISKSFGGLQAVSEASLKVSEGSIVSLIGPNGAGKTTLFAIISGFLKADSGTVNLYGDALGGLKPFQVCQMGMVRTFQITQPFAKLSILENIMIGAYARIQNPEDATHEACKVAERVGIRVPLESSAADLNVAGRKRLELARALATQPRLLVCDEPTSALDVSIQAQILNLLKDLQEQLNLTILFISHDLPVVRQMCDRIAVLKNGKLCEISKTEELFKNPSHNYTKELLTLMPKIESIYN